MPRSCDKPLSPFRFLEEFKQEVLSDHSQVWKPDYQPTSVHFTEIMPEEDNSVIDRASLDALPQEQTALADILLEDQSHGSRSGVVHQEELGSEDHLVDVLNDSNDLLNLSLQSADSFGSLPDLDIDELLAGDSSVFNDNVGLGRLHEDLRDLGALELNEEVSQVDVSLPSSSLNVSDPGMVGISLWRCMVSENICRIVS